MLTPQEMQSARGAITTMVWHGKSATPTNKEKKVKRNLVKGARSIAAVFLLEAMVLLSAGTCWASAWTQKMYGTGMADIWEIYGEYGVLTSLAHKQGWRTLEPVREAEFRRPAFEEGVNQTFEIRAPRLVVM